MKIIMFCLPPAVFRCKVIDGHFSEDLGMNEAAKGSHSRSMASRETDSSMCHEREDELEQESLSIMKKHLDFIDKQTISAHRYKMSRKLETTVSSKRPIDDISATENPPKDQQGKRIKTQAEKNRTRKLKKRKKKLNSVLK